MTFTAVSAGQLIKASVTNANMRHVGRLGGHMIPENTSGVGVDATYDNGTPTYQWRNICFSGKLYQNGVEFKGGGGGGGGLGLAEAKSWFEKMGQVFPYSDPGVLNESYTRTDNIVLTPRIGTGAGATTIVLDNNKTDIDLMEATTGWTGGKTTGTGAVLASDTTAGERVQGSASNKLTVTAVSDLAWMIKDHTAFSLIDQLFTASVYLDALPAGLVKLSVRLSSTAGGATNYKEYDILKANLVSGAGTFNHISIDVNNDTASATNGTFIPGAVVATHFYLTFNASTTILMAVDYLVRQSNIPIVETGKTYKSWIWDATNQEPLYLNAVAGVTNVTRNIFTCAALTNAYAVGTTYAKQRSVTISGQQGQWVSGASGANALKCYDMKEYWLTKSVTADVPLSWRFYDTEYKISSLPSATETRITVPSDIKAGFKTGDMIILYQRQTNGIGMMSRYNSTVGLNFKILTLSADSTYSAPELVLTHATGVNTGISVGNWYVTRFSVRAMALLEAMSANGTMAYVTPLSFWVNAGGNTIFSDDFNRADGAPTNNWTAPPGNRGTVWRISSNMMYKPTSGNTYDDLCCFYRNNENYIPLNGSREITFKFKLECGTTSQYSDLYVLIASNNTNDASGGTGVKIKTNGGVAGRCFQVWNNNAAVATSATWTYNSGDLWRIRMQVSSSNVKIRAWLDGTTEPTVWDLDFNTPLTVSGSYLKIYGAGYESGGLGNEIWLDDFIYKEFNTGYTVTGKITGSGDKFSQALEYSRSDTANQNPVGYQFDAYVPGLTE